MLLTFKNLNAQAEYNAAQRAVYEMVEQVHTPLLVTNYTGKIEIVNSALCRLYGCGSAEELKGKDVMMLMTHADAQFYRQQLTNYFKTHLSFTIDKKVERFLKRRNGELAKVIVYTR